MSGGDGTRLDEVETLAGMGSWTWDVTGNTLAWSPGLRRILGIADAVPASFEAWLGRVHPDDQSTVKRYFTRLRREAGFHEIEYRVIGAAVRTISTRACATADAARVRVIGADQDITQRQETAARIVLSDRLIAIGTLAGGVAHEINNPLAIIAANLQLVVNGAELALLDEAQRAVERIRTIVRGLTAFSRSTDDPRLAVDLVRVLEMAISLTGSTIRHRARLVTDLGPVPWVRADEARLGQVFLNLLANASEAVPEGSAAEHAIRIRTRTDAAGWAIVDIEDTGSGIPVDVQPRVFDPFFTTKPVGQGTGLGLAICHGIVRALGGDITFRSVPGRGTTFSVALPPGEPSPRGAAPRLETAVDAHRGHVLIVDDEVLFATSLKRLLATDHEVTLARSGREALELVRGGTRFDAILCDLMMPEMTGAELHAALSELAPALARRMIFITGGAFSPASQAFLDGISNPWFEKPCDLGRLRTALRAIVGTT